MENFTHVPNFQTSCFTLRYGLTCTDQQYITIRCSFLRYITLHEGGKPALDQLRLQPCMGLVCPDCTYFPLVSADCYSLCVFDEYIVL